MQKPAVALLTLLLCACGPSTSKKTTTIEIKPDAPPEIDVQSDWVDPETVGASSRARESIARAPAPPVLIKNTTILTATGKRIEKGSIVVEGGKITQIAEGELPAPKGAIVIAGNGRFVTPGIIDAHSHIGVYPYPGAVANSDGNEATDPNTAGVAAEYAYTAQDPAIERALAGGVTAALILPGSANLIGGRGFTVEMRQGRDTDAVRFPGAPQTLKMACGENPKRVYGKKSGPQTRMGVYAAFRQAYQAAVDYRAKQKLYRIRRAEWDARRARAGELDAATAKKGGKKRVKPEGAPDPVPRDAKLETLAGVLEGKVLLQVHCYTVRDMEQMLAISDEMGFQVRAFHHALEAYKIRDHLARRGVAIATWADWWGFKLEALDGIPENAALMFEAGGRVAIHSDSSIGIQRLNQEAAKAMAAGRAAGMTITDDDTLKWVTANPAWVLGIDDVTGTLEDGKRGDVVLWSEEPFSVYARADVVLVAGDIAYQRNAGVVPSDFELGNSAIDIGGAR